MRYRLHPAVLVALVAGLCVLAVFTAAFLRSRPDSTIAGLLSRFPPEDCVVLSIDVRALRRAGILESIAGPRVTEEPEYQGFVAETGFDYREDLDSVLVAFQKNATCFFLRGRFDWKKLWSYVAAQEGVCHNSLCRMKGSEPDRNISFFPLSTTLMAMAVSRDSWGVTHLIERRQQGGQSLPLPNQPVWFHIPVSSLQDDRKLPDGARRLAQAMAGARTITLSLGPRGSGFEAVLDVTCGSSEEAAVLSLRLEGTTRLLRDLIAKENKMPNPDDLSGVLAAGTFRAGDLHVEGRWPVERVFLESLAARSF